MCLSPGAISLRSRWVLGDAVGVPQPRATPLLLSTTLRPRSRGPGRPPSQPQLSAPAGRLPKAAAVGKTSGGTAVPRGAPLLLRRLSLSALAPLSACAWARELFNKE